MDRYAVYPDISPGYVVLDTLSERIVALYRDVRTAQRAARRLNAPAPVGSRVRPVGENAETDPGQ
jgi:hypothetical protein